MSPTLEPGDRLMIWVTPAVRPGDLVAVLDPRGGGRRLVKRVADATGDLVVLRGDNPRVSTDSRTFGPVPRSSIQGRVLYRYSPHDRAGRLTRQSQR